jgi:hypothetical protein
MKLTEIAIEKLNTVENRLKLALFLAVTEQSVIRYITQNIEDGPLTREYVKPFISKLAGLTESQLLEERVTA